MSTIKVTPEQLLYVSRQIEQGRQQLEGIRNDLTARIGFIQSQWAGATQERFFYDFQQSRSVLDRALESMVKSSQDLFAIAERFEQADQEQVSLGAVAGQIAAHIMMNHNISNTEEQRRMYIILCLELTCLRVKRRMVCQGKRSLLSTGNRVAPMKK